MGTVAVQRRFAVVGAAVGLIGAALCTALIWRVPSLRTDDLAATGIRNIEIIPVPVSRSAPAVDETVQPETLQEVVDKIERTRQRFATYTLEQEWTTVDGYVPMPDAPEGLPKEDVTTRHSMRITRSGERFVVSRSELRNSQSGSGADTSTVKGVSNAKYCAEYHQTPSPEISLYQHGPQEGESESIADWLPKPCVLDYGFGNGDLTVSEHIQNGNPEDEWSIAVGECNGVPVQQITVRTPVPDGRAWVSHYYVDPNRDYLVRGFDQYLLDGAIGRSCRVELAYSESGKTWYPERVTYTDSYDSSVRSDMTVKRLDFAPEITDGTFDFTAFGDFEPGTKLTEVSAARDRSTSYEYQDGQWKRGRTELAHE